MSSYAELVCRTAFSFHEGTCLPEELVERARELGLGALAVTDRDGVYALPRAHKHALKHGLQLICGALVTVQGGPGLALLARTPVGWRNLCRLLTRARCGGTAQELSRVERWQPDKGRGRVPLDSVLEAAEGLDAVLLGAWTAEHVHLAREAFTEHASLGAACLVDGQDVRRLAERAALARQTGVALVATNDVQLGHRRDKPLHDVLTAIRLHCTVEQAGRALPANAERHLKGGQEMSRLFAGYPQAIERTWEVAERCRFTLTDLDYRYPREVVPPGQDPMSWLRQLTAEGLAWRYPRGAPSRVQAQCEHELALVEKLDFPAYFLTVYDAVRFAREQGILCQGRGSAANSAVCFALGITSVDPATSSLLFERFISEERGEPPDIDVDFEHERREEVIQYLYSKYGRQRAGMVSAVVTYRPRSAVRDVGKALGLSLDQVDNLSKRMHWFDRGPVTSEQLRDAGLDPTDRAVQLTVEISHRMAGLPRHVGIHSGGFTITDCPLVDMVPVEPATMENRSIIQWDKDDLDIVGFIKVDFLALGMLTAIRKSFELVGRHWKVDLDLADIPPDDAAVYDMACAADTVGVFQIESRAQMSMLPRLRPRNFYDLVIEISLVRPGPIQGGMVHPYLKRRRGEEPVVYAHPDLEPILERTLGVPIFQEQVMAMAVAVGGFTPGEADELRRAMGAWRKRGGLLSLTTRLMGNMRDRGIDPEYARQVASQIQGFGEYGFPESHAASFARLVYVSSWLKCHYPAAFTAALINSQPLGFYAPRTLVDDARRHGVTVRPVDHRFSTWDCTLEPDKPGLPALRLGFRLLKGFAEDAAQRLVGARAQGSFTSIADLQHRAELDRRAMGILARSDSLRGFELDRRQARWVTEGLYDLPLFRGLSRSEGPAPLPAPTPSEELLADFASMGLSTERNPIGMVREQLVGRGILTTSQALAQPANSVIRVAGLVAHRQRPGTAKGVVFMTIEDETGMVQLVVQAWLFDKQRSIICGERLVCVRTRVQRDGESKSLLALHFDKLQDATDVPASSRNFH